MTLYYNIYYNIYYNESFLFFFFSSSSPLPSYLPHSTPSDLSRNSSLPHDLLSLFSSPLEDIKSAAAYALGNVCVGNLGMYVPMILEEIGGEGKRQYLLLSALKEVRRIWGNRGCYKKYGRVFDICIMFVFMYHVLCMILYHVLCMILYHVSCIISMFMLFYVHVHDVPYCIMYHAHVLPYHVSCCIMLYHVHVHVHDVPYSCCTMFMCMSIMYHVYVHVSCIMYHIHIHESCS